MPGARQPEYRVTADDVNAYLAIEVQPLDDRKRKVLFWFLFFSLCTHVCIGHLCFNVPVSRLGL